MRFRWRCLEFRFGVLLELRFCWLSFAVPSVCVGIVTALFWSSRVACSMIPHTTGPSHPCEEGCLILSFGIQFGIWFGGLAFPFPGPSPVPASLPNTPCLIPRGNSFETKTNIRIQKQQNRTHSSTKNNITKLKHQKMPIETQLQSMPNSKTKRDTKYGSTRKKSNSKTKTSPTRQTTYLTCHSPWPP